MLLLYNQCILEKWTKHYMQVSHLEENKQEDEQMYGLQVQQYIDEE